MNKIKNIYYLKVAIIFSLLTCLVPLISWHYYLYTEKSLFIYDDLATAIYSLLFIIEVGLYLVFYGLGRWLDCNIRPLIIVVSFGDFGLVFCGLWFVSIIVKMGPVDFFAIFSHLGFDLYFILLFLSKFLLIYILKRK